MSDERHSEAQLLSILAFLALVALLAVASSFLIHAKSQTFLSGCYRPCTI